MRRNKSCRLIQLDVMAADAAHLVTLLGEGPAERKEAFEALEARAARGLQGGSSSSRGIHATAIHVGGLEGEELEDEANLERLFGRFGTVVATTLRRRREDGKVSWALVSFRTDEEARAALDGMQDLAARYTGLVTRSVDEIQAVYSTGAMGAVMRQHIQMRAERRQQDLIHADAAVACTAALCAAMCRDASEVDLEEFQRMSELLLALAALDPIRVGGELLKPTQPNLSAICMSTESVFGAALSKNPRAGHELTEAGARKN